MLTVEIPAGTEKVSSPGLAYVQLSVLPERESTPAAPHGLAPSAGAAPTSIVATTPMAAIHGLTP
jgi:hypothetical protein